MTILRVLAAIRSQRRCDALVRLAADERRRHSAAGALRRVCVDEAGHLESIDMNDALHPQTLVAYAMNDGELPVGFGGPLRLRLPWRLGYKSVNYITETNVTDDVTKFRKGLGSAASDAGYERYAGI